MEDLASTLSSSLPRLAIGIWSGIERRGGKTRPWSHPRLSSGVKLRTVRMYVTYLIARTVLRKAGLVGDMASDTGKAGSCDPVS